MTARTSSLTLFALATCGLSIPSLALAQRGNDLPDWFDRHRIQSHFENRITDDLGGLYQQLHPSVREMGSVVLTRIFKTTAEGAWWKTEAGYTHEPLEGRDLGKEIAQNAHQHGLKVFAYYRIMCDDFVEREHPEWLCRDTDGQLVLEPRTRRARQEADRKHVICFNSPARALVETRLLELADRGVDGIYFDSWHMPEVCTCESCRDGFRKETGQPMLVSAARDSEDYRRMADFVARSVVRNFRQWKDAVTLRHPDTMFAIGSSLYPCFDTQMQITAALLDISNTSKIEFAKPFGGFLGWPIVDGRPTQPNRRRPYMDDTYALPSYDLQNALGWSLTRDSCDGRPPLKWIPFTRTEQEATFSAAAAMSYGCIASLHPTGLRERRSTAIQTEATDKYRPAYALGDKISPHLAGTRPYRFALLHIGEHSRNLRIADGQRLWTEFFAPLLGAFEVLKEQHLPVATINDLHLSRGIPAETRVLILANDSELTDQQRTAIGAFEDRGGTILRLGTGKGWHRRGDKSRLKHELAVRLQAAVPTPPIRATGSDAMHAVFYRDAAATKTVVCLVNDFGWYRSERTPNPSHATPSPPEPCSGVTIEVTSNNRVVQRAYDAATGEPLALRHQDGKTTILVAEFPIMTCVVVE